MGQVQLRVKGEEKGKEKYSKGKRKSKLKRGIFEAERKMSKIGRGF